MPQSLAPVGRSHRVVDVMLRISDTIRRTETQDGGILLDVHHGQMFSLNLVGAKILEMLQRGYDEPRITEEISRAYQIDRDTVQRDVAEFIESLHKHHILQVPRPTSGI